MKKLNPLKMKLGLSIVLSFAVILIFAFQNCSAGRLATGPNNFQVDDSAVFFTYPYSVAPVFYTSAQIFVEDSGVQGINQYKIAVAAAYLADSTVPVSYQVQVYGDGGAQTICPTVSGTLQPGESAIQFECDTPDSPTSEMIQIQVSALADHQTDSYEFY